MLALVDTFLLMLMRLCRLDQVVLRNLDDLVNPSCECPPNTISLMAYRRRLSRVNKKSTRSEGQDPKRNGRSRNLKRLSRT